MKRRNPDAIPAAFLLLALAPAALAAEPSAPLIEGMGTHHHPVTTSSPRAQRYFDQGLIWYYAFNHDEAVCSFRRAADLDPDCAMAWWGLGYALGPNINLPLTDDAIAQSGIARDRIVGVGVGASGLVNPHTRARPFAVVQLRQDNLAGTLYNLVGFQTNLRWSEQERVFRLIPGLERAVPAQN